MPNYKLSPKSDDDLDDIGNYTYEERVTQSEKYLKEITINRQN